MDTMSTKRTIAIARTKKVDGSRIMRTSYARKQQFAVATRKPNHTCKRTMDLKLQPNESKKRKTMEKRPKFDQPADEYLNLRECKAVVTRSNKRKLINEWLQETSNNNIDSNLTEILQDANLFNLSDVEDDAFQLAKYLESSDQTIHASSVISMNPASLQRAEDTKSLESSVNRWDETTVSEINFYRLNDSPNKRSTPTNCFGNDITMFNISSPRSHDLTYSESRFDEDSPNKQSTPTKSFGNDISTFNISSPRIHDLPCSEWKLDENGNENHKEENSIRAESDQNNQNLINETDTILPEFSEELSSDISQKVLSEQNRTIDNTKLQRVESNKTSDGMEFTGLTQAPLNTELQTTAMRLDSTLLTAPSAAGNIVSSDAVKYAGAYTRLTRNNTGAYARITRNNALKQQITNLFNRPCYNYLNGKHCRNYMCKWNHYLPAAHDVFLKMMRFSNDTVMHMYNNFIMRTKTVFVSYFPIICDIFGKKKMKSSLMNAIKDCEQLDQIPFIKCIFNGLVMTGLSKHEALTIIADCCTKSRAINDLFLEIIIETDPLYFLDMLKSYYRYATITPHHLSQLLKRVIDTPAPLLNVFIDILDQYSMYHVCDVETFKSVVSTAKSLVDGDFNLSQRLNLLASRVP